MEVSEKNFDKISEVQMKFMKDITAPIFWYDGSKSSDQNFPNGTATFLKTKEGLFVVTCFHVYEGYLKAKNEIGERFVSKILNLRFNFEERLIDQNRSLDLATFWIKDYEMKCISIEEPKFFIEQVYSFDCTKLDGGFYMAGFPGKEKIINQLRPRSLKINFGIIVLGCGFDVRCINDREISIDLDANRADWRPMLTDGNEIFSENYPCGGMSGGAIVSFLERKNSGVAIPYLIGIIYQGPNGEENHTGIGMNIIKATRATFINDNGKLDVSWLP